MKYTLNEYLPYLSDPGTRIEVPPNRELAAKLVSDYSDKGAMVVPLSQLLPRDTKWLPSPAAMVDTMQRFGRTSHCLTVFVGIESYLVFLQERAWRDFFVGLYALIEQQEFHGRFLIGRLFFLPHSNPKYENAMQIVHFQGEIASIDDLEIQLFPAKWVPAGRAVPMVVPALEQLGIYIPSGQYRFSVEEKELRSAGAHYLTVVTNGGDALEKLYGIDGSFEPAQADQLLCQCAQCSATPNEVLTQRFGGEAYLTCDRAPMQLARLREDALWDFYVWLLKGKLSVTTYLYHVLAQAPTAETFLQQYVVTAAISLLGDSHAASLAEERGRVLQRLGMIEPLIEQFVRRTEEDGRSVPFLNCGTSVEMQGLIRRAAKLGGTARLPEDFDRSMPILNFYLDPYYSYGNQVLTQYFHQLRYNRLRDWVDADFVQLANDVEVPPEIEHRDMVLRRYDDGGTGLLVVDGMGAEYYPLLCNLANHNHLNLESRQIVTVNLPSSTQFNPISWSNSCRLPEVKRADDISHAGYSKFEACRYEENLAETLLLFHKRVLPRVVEGLLTYKRVVVTADHGVSYLAVTAYRKNLVQTIPWEDPEDWRYTVSTAGREAPDGTIPVYHPEDGLTYFVGKGYHRLPKRGSKLYGLHGGASLEERLVPLVVFTREAATAVNLQPEEEFLEDEAFDIL